MNKEKKELEFQKLIEFIIKKRKEVYYLVTETDLNDLKTKNTYSEIAYLISSVLLGGFISIIIALNFNQNLETEIKSTFFLWLIIFGVLGLIFLGIAIYFVIVKRNSINQLKGKEEISFEPESYVNHLNPNSLLGDKQLIMNIPKSEREKLYSLVQARPELKLIKTAEKKNINKTEHFTFEIDNANDLLYNHFEELLKNSDINYMDYKFRVKRPK